MSHKVARTYAGFAAEEQRLVVREAAAAAEEEHLATVNVVKDSATTKAATPAEADGFQREAEVACKAQH